MSFSEVLKETVDRVPGAVAALIVASDGIPVQEYAVEKLIDFNDLSAEASTLIKDIEMASEELKLGRAKEFALISDRCGIIMHRITSEYYYCVVIRPDGNYGKARFVIKTVIPRIEKEF
ncbi:MAG: hypothetical protein GXO99_05645 [Nitrospirae bacterium]|nr:hypothetical protein [Nitrospirota bacterium]